VVALVLDSSAAVAWFMPDEQSSEAQRLLDVVTEHGAIVPSLWPLEVANSLLIGVRRNRVSPEHCRSAMTWLGELPITIDNETTTRAWGVTFHFAARFGLTLYDACYLELAQRRELPLASLDRELRAAGRALGLKLLGV
jgi:predicted nucleic acid-binding protein